jgi:arylsulfatase A
VSLPGTECSTPVITMDLCATMAAASGVKAPDDGVDLRPLLRGENIQPRELYWHYPHYHPGGATPYSAVLSEGLRLVHFHEDERVELYDLAADPGEKNDLAPTRLAARESLKKKLEVWLKQTGAQMPAPNPKHDPAKDR